jgi:hypothetical protein
MIFTAHPILSGYKMGKNEWAGHVVHIVEGIGLNILLVGKREGKRQPDGL